MLTNRWLGLYGSWLFRGKVWGHASPFCHLTSYDFLWAAEDAELGGNLGQLPGQISLAPEMAQVGDFKLLFELPGKVSLFSPSHHTWGPWGQNLLC